MPLVAGKRCSVKKHGMTHTTHTGAQSMEDSVPRLNVEWDTYHSHPLSTLAQCTLCPMPTHTLKPKPLSITALQGGGEGGLACV